MHDKQRIRAGKILIRRIYLEDWDPIGVGDHPLAQDEYDRYLGRMYTLLEQNAPVEKIASYLSEITSQNIGLKPDKDRIAEAAKKLKALRW